MKLSQEKYVKYEFGLSLLFFVYFVFLSFKGQNFFSIYFVIVLGFTTMMVILTIVLLIITKSKDVESDERDKVINLKAYRNGYISLISFVNIAIIFSFLSNLIFEPFILLNILFAVLFISHIILTATKIFYYKRGV